MIGNRLLSVLGIIFLAASASTANAEEHIEIGVAQASAGAVGSFPVTFYSNSIIPLTAGIEVDISYDSHSTPIRANAGGAPDCTPNPAAGKGDTRFAFLPTGCSGTGCTSIRAIVVSFSDVSPIARMPEGVELFACNVRPPIGTVPGTYLLIVDYLIGSDEFGNPVSMTARDGFVAVSDAMPGDCDGNGIVTIADLVRSVNIALGGTLTDCRGADLNGDGTVDISELIATVNAALNGVPKDEVAEVTLRKPSWSPS